MQQNSIINREKRSKGNKVFTGNKARALYL